MKWLHLQRKSSLYIRCLSWLIRGYLTFSYRSKKKKTVRCCLHHIPLVICASVGNACVNIVWVFGEQTENAECALDSQGHWIGVCHLATYPYNVRHCNCALILFQCLSVSLPLYFFFSYTARYFSTAVGVEKEQNGWYGGHYKVDSFLLSTSLQFELSCIGSAFKSEIMQWSHTRYSFS